MRDGEKEDALDDGLFCPERPLRSPRGRKRRRWLLLRCVEGRGYERTRRKREGEVVWATRGETWSKAGRRCRDDTDQLDGAGGGRRLAGWQAGWQAGWLADGHGRHGRHLAGRQAGTTWWWVHLGLGSCWASVRAGWAAAGGAGGSGPWAGGYLTDHSEICSRSAEI